MRTLDAAARPAALIPALLAAIGSLREGNLRGDDVTVLLFRPTGAGLPPPLRDRLLAPVRVLRGMLSSLRPGAGPAPLPEWTLTNIGGAVFSALNRRWRGRPAGPTAGRAGILGKP